MGLLASANFDASDAFNRVHLKKIPIKIKQGVWGQGDKYRRDKKMIHTSGSSGSSATSPQHSGSSNRVAQQLFLCEDSLVSTRISLPLKVRLSWPKSHSIPVPSEVFKFPCECSSKAWCAPFTWYRGLHGNEDDFKPLMV